MKPAILHLIGCLSRQAADVATPPGVADSDLLGRVVRERDEVAFADLLHRHGRLIWGVCRGLLPNDADAEDAFQATFVALFQGVAKIRRAGSLAPWLHSTATRIAKKVRLAAARRVRRERRSAKPESAPAAVSDATWEALHLAVHDEIARLPAILRAAFVSCVLEGLRHEDAAAQLGVPVGTLSARVSRARKRLLERLSRRGLAPGAAVAVVCEVSAVSAAVPGSVLHQVRGHLADGFASVPANVVHFARAAGGVAMSVRLLVAALMVGTLTAIGVWAASGQQPQPGREADPHALNGGGQGKGMDATKAAPLKVFVSGVCRNKEDKKPVVNAVVQFHIARLEPRRMDVWKTTRTDLDGFFALEGEYPSEPASEPRVSVITVRASGRASGYFYWQPDAEYKEPIAWDLPAAAKLEGRVVDADGRPVAGAHVYVSFPRIDGINDAVSSKDGRFVIDDMQPWDGTNHPLLTGLYLLARHKDFPKWGEGTFKQIPAAEIEIRFPPRK